MPLINEILINDQPLKTPIRILRCDTFFYRLRGMMFRKLIHKDEGLLLVQDKESKVDSSIHMLFVPMELGIIWINSNLNIVDIKIAKPWRLAYIPASPAKYTLEIHPERIFEFNIGDKVHFNEI